MNHITFNDDATTTIGIKAILQLYKNHYEKSVNGIDNDSCQYYSRFICDVVKDYLKSYSYGVAHHNFSANFQSEWIREFNPKLGQHLADTISRIHDCAPWEEPQILNDMMYWNAGGDLDYLFNEMNIPVNEVYCAKIILMRGNSVSKLEEMEYRLRVLSAAAVLHPLFSVTF